MNELFRNVASPSWWVGVVLVGVVTSIVAAYAKPPLDRSLGRVSRSWATRTAARRKVFLERVQKASADEAVRAELRFEVCRNLLVSILFMVGGSSVVLLGTAFVVLEDPVASMFAMGFGGVVFLVGASRPLFDNSYQVLLQAKSDIGLTAAAPDGRNDVKGGRG